MQADHQVSAATPPTLDYRPKGMGRGIDTTRGATAARFTFVTFAVLLAIGAVILFTFALSDLTTERGVNLPVSAGAFGCAAGGVVVVLLGNAYMRKCERTSRSASLCCDGCGYDLRASSERCPECGRPVPVDRDEVARRLQEMED